VRLPSAPCVGTGTPVGGTSGARIPRSAWRRCAGARCGGSPTAQLLVAGAVAATATARLLSRLGARGQRLRRCSVAALRWSPLTRLATSRRTRGGSSG
jgi:hypothetical protein